MQQPIFREKMIRLPDHEFHHVVFLIIVLYLVLYICIMAHSLTLEYKIKINRSGLYQ